MDDRNGVRRNVPYWQILSGMPGYLWTGTWYGSILFYLTETAQYKYR